jgi:hypothetical protein
MLSMTPTTVNDIWKNGENERDSFEDPLFPDFTDWDVDDYTWDYNEETDNWIEDRDGCINNNCSNILLNWLRGEGEEDKDVTDYGDEPDFEITDAEFNLVSHEVRSVPLTLTRFKRGAIIASMVRKAGVLALRLGSSGSRMARIGGRLHRYGSRLSVRSAYVGRWSPSMSGYVRLGGSVGRRAYSNAGVQKALRWMAKQKLIHPTAHKIIVSTLVSCVASGVGATVWWAVTNALVNIAEDGDMERLELLASNVMDAAEKMLDEDEVIYAEEMRRMAEYGMEETRSSYDIELDDIIMENRMAMAEKKKREREKEEGEEEEEIGVLCQLVHNRDHDACYRSQRTRVNTRVQTIPM